MKRPLFQSKAIARVSFFITLFAVVNASAQTVPPTVETPPTAPPVSDISTPSAAVTPEPSPATLPTPAPAAAPATAPRVQKFDLNEAASRYVALVMEADRIATMKTLSPEALQTSLRVTSRMSSKGISEGAGAFAALTAASHSEFAASFATVVNILGRDAVIVRLKDNPDQLFGMINGYGSAVKLSSGALSSSLEKLVRAETVLGEAAYSVQKEAWAQRAVDTQGTLAALRAEALAPHGLDELTAWTMPPAISDDPLNSRYLLAASYILLGDQVSASEVLDRPLGKMCMNRVQLNIRQCVAASQFPYEHAFCLSRHSFGEASLCVKAATK
jgi:hypothetical protein